MTEASSASQTPSETSSAPSEVPSEPPTATAATSVASRVLPVPPGPTSVTSRYCCSALSTRATSSSRPTKLVSWARRFVRACRLACIAPGSAAEVPLPARLTGAGPAGRAAASPLSTSRCTACNSAPGSMPSSSASLRRIVSYAASASACRPDAASARISSPVTFSSSGCWAASSSSGPTCPLAGSSATSLASRATIASSCSRSSRWACGAANSPASASAGPRHSPIASSGRPSASSRWNRNASTSSGLIASRYPAADCSTAWAPPSARRARDTSVCSALARSAGGSSPQTASPSPDVLTGRPPASASRTIRSRSRAPEMTTGAPPSSVTSSGPKIATCTRPLSPNPGGTAASAGPAAAPRAQDSRSAWATPYADGVPVRGAPQHEGA